MSSEPAAGPSTDEELKALVRRGDWPRLEAESRRAIAVRVSRAADLGLATALLRQGKLAELEPHLETTLRNWPQGTLRFLDGLRAQQPGLYDRLMRHSVFVSPRPFHAAGPHRRKWPRRATLDERAAYVSLLEAEVFAAPARRLRPRPKDTVRVFTLGSCFAQHLANRLRGLGVAAETLALAEEVNTTFACRAVLEFLEDGRPDAAAQVLFDSPQQAAEARPKLARFLSEASHLVITVGVAPAFFGTDGRPRLAGLARELTGDGAGLEWRMSTVEQNVENLLAMLSALERLNPRADLVLTLSPVPLSASFSEEGVAYDDLLSKATLRLAIDQALKAFPRALYWPSFEAVKWLPAHADWAAYGTEDGNSRHVASWLVDVVVGAFAGAVASDADQAPSGVQRA